MRMARVNMSSLPRSGLEREYIDLLNESIVSKYVLRKLKYRKYNRRPLELKYLYIAKATRLTYKQVRRIMDKMVASKKIEKYQAWEDKNLRRNFYRLVV